MTSTQRADLVYRLTVARNVAGAMLATIENAMNSVRDDSSLADSKLEAVCVGLRMLGQMGEEIELANGKRFA